jgi:polysaccharide export outer membrane protein
MGLVNRSDQYEIPEDLPEPRLLDALAMAGGQSLSIADKVHVIRQLPGRAEPVVIQASVRAAKADLTSNIQLAAGDVVSVEETPTTFVVGTIKDFVRFGFSSAIPGF